MNHCTYSADCGDCVSYKETLLDVRNVSLSYGDKQILRDVTVQVLDVERKCHVQGQVVGFLGPSGIGKCLAKGTKVLMYDGTIKSVEDVIVGDFLMGPDSKPRHVLCLGKGVDDMYDVSPVKGEPYRVNADHILALWLIKSKRSRWGCVEISVKDYLKQSHTFKFRAKGYRVPIVFPAQSVPLDPYFFGLWLGDGSSMDANITTMDPEVIACVESVAASVGGRMVKYDYKDGKCPRYNIDTGWNRKLSVQTKLRMLGVLGNKHIPLLYKANDRAVQLSVLAGLLDADGSLESNCFVLTVKSKTLSQDAAFIARSLGLAAYTKPCKKRSQNGTEGNYFRTIISGDVGMIPVRLQRRKASPRRQSKDVLRTGITVKGVERGEYYGFQIDGDGLFLLGDFTVTHNTQLFRIIAGLQKPTSGGVFINSTHDPVRAGMVGVVSQSYTLFEHRTVLGNMVLGAMKKEPSRKAAIEKSMDLLNRFGLADKAHSYPALLSGGMRQRVAIAQQMLCSEHFILMDEPFSGLDLVNLEKVFKLITDVACMDTLNTLVVVTHDVTAAASVSDHLWLMGHDRDPEGNIVPGARIQEVYDLVSAGLCWQENILTRPDFLSFVATVKERFRTL